MPATPQTRAELEDLLVAYISDPLNKQNSAAAVRTMIRAVFNSSYNRADDPLNPSTPPGAASYGTITGVPEDSASLDNRLSTIRALASRAPNRAANNTKAVKWLTNADREAAGGTDADGETAEDSFPLHTAGTNPLNLGTVFRAESGLEGVLVYDDGTNTDPAIPRLANVFRDGGQTVAGQPAKLVLVDSVEALYAGVRQYDAGIDDYAEEEFITAIVGGVVRSFRLLPSQAPGPLPAPTGGTDAHYREVAPLAPPFALYQDLTQIQAIAMLDDLVAVEGREYGVAFPARTMPTARPAITVYLKGVQGGTFSGAGEIIDPGNVERTVPVTVDVRSGAIVDIQQLLEALASPLRTATPDNRLIGYNTLDEAANAGTEDSIVYINRGVVTVAAPAVFGGGTLFGDGGSVEAASGATLQLSGTVRVYDVNLYAAAFVFAPASTSTLSRVVLAYAEIQAGATVNAADCQLFDNITGAGTLVLQAGTQMSPAHIASTRAAGVTVIDERPNAGYDVPSAIKTAVSGGSFTNGELNGTQPAGSQVGMKFYDTAYTYECFGAKWVRCAKG